MTFSILDIELLISFISILLIMNHQNSHIYLLHHNKLGKNGMSQIIFLTLNCIWSHFRELCDI